MKQADRQTDAIDLNNPCSLQTLQTKNADKAVSNTYLLWRRIEIYTHCTGSWMGFSSRSGLKGDDQLMNSAIPLSKLNSDMLDLRFSRR
jgi:hypothetical protein